MARATFGAGCFWGIEEAFRGVSGVTDTAVGYMGGTVDFPTYRQVCSKTTGHAEVVQVEYDPERVPFERLLSVFWSIHDPTQLNRQGPDVGTQYRSVVFYHDEAQREAAERSKAHLQQNASPGHPIVTEISPAATFWRAEEYHQRYIQKNGGHGCAIG